MKTLYLELAMGAAGDMLNAALYELLDNDRKEKYVSIMNSLGLDGVSVKPEKVIKQGITGTHMSVRIDGAEEGEEYRHDHEHHHEDHEHHHDHHHDDHDHDEHHHHHSSMRDIEDIISALPLSDKIKADVTAVYKLIAEAESAAHDRPVTDIHFHEVGTMDAVADITGACVLMDMLSPDRVAASPVHVGSGHVHCAHGILPVPAPATAYILKGIPMYGGSIRGELCTPTGAALLKYFVCGFGNMPVMRTERTGYGMGKKDFEQLNCVRAMLGESAEEKDEICVLSCNLDDMTPERIAYCTEKLLEAGASEVYTTPVMMKKSRLGTLLTVLCSASKREEIVALVFKHTSTIGIREHVDRRYVLDRHTDTINTEYGDVRIKRSEGYGVSREKYEYDDIARIADENDESIEDVAEHLREYNKK